MARRIETSQIDANQLDTATPGPVKPRAGQGASRIAAFLVGIPGAFLLTGFLFFALLTLFGILVTPLIRLQSASFVIAGALILAAGLSIYLHRCFRRWMHPPR